MCKHWIARGLLALLGFGALLWPTLQSTVLAEGKEEGFVSLFNGKDLTGWEGKPGLWRVRDGMMVGDSPGIRHNTFLATTRTYEDFILKLSFRLVNGKGNSGVQFRSRRVPDSEAVSGYQADIGEQFWGSLYDESRRRRILVDARKAGVDAVVNVKGWNDLVIRCRGNQVTIELNGLKTVDYREPDLEIARSGIIAFQVHSGGPMEIQFRNIRIRELGE